MVYTSPVIVGHRGFKAKYPENTIVGFEKCFQNGGTIIETDTWLTKDQILIISHDVSTKRIFVDKDGNETDFIIPQHNYDELKDLKTVEGNYPLMTFQQLLTWFVGYSDSQPNGQEDYKIMLDIKRLNAVKILRFIIKDLLAVRNDLGWWLNKVQFGIWDLNFIKFFNQDEYFQQLFYGKELGNQFGYNHFDIINISGSWRHSIQYINYNFYLDNLKDDSRFKFKITGISLLHFSTWSPDFLTKFVPLLRLQNLKFYSWTINTTEQFDYVSTVGKAAKLREYGVISDLPDEMYQHKLSHEDQSSSSTDQINSSGDDDLESKAGINQEFYNDNGDLSIKLTFKQRFANWFFTTLTSFGSKPTTEINYEETFKSIVDENYVVQQKPSKIFIWIFATLQHYGLA
ncbi:Glycerophosphodiester phosphodiesterase [Scheffersomyces amazonensis]|uniref:Glycerophosphodiester phosphodiesterase n=1 Tax=Scheffersomyces amazonensis TaxID=1078765 RepID=UPI00315DA618